MSPMLRSTAIGLPRACALACALALPAVAAPPTVSVAFVEPDRYADIGRTAADRDRALAALRSAFESLAAARLSTDQTLRIEVLNVDLAGFLVPSTRSPGLDIRVRRGSGDPALIGFRWTLGAGGSVVASGEERLVDIDTSFQTEHDPAQSLGLERRMIERWLDERIGRPADAAGSRP